MRARTALTLMLAGALAIVAGSALAAKPTRFWNLTQYTVTAFALAPAGTSTFGPDQTKNDKDGSVDHDERMKILATPTGLYDVQLKDSKGRTCMVKNVSIKEGEVFSIEEKQLTCDK